MYYNDIYILSELKITFFLKIWRRFEEDFNIIRTNRSAYSFNRYNDFEER